MAHSPGEQMDSPLQRLLPYLIPVWLLLFWVIFFTSTLPNSSTANESMDRLTFLLLMPEIYSGLFSSGESPEASSWGNLAERVDVFCVAMLIVAGAVSCGRLILRGLGIWSVLARSDRLALAGGIGFSAVSLGTLALGVAGLLYQRLFALLLGALIVVEVVRSLRDKPALIVESSQAALAPRWLRRSVLLISVPFVCCMMLGAMLPPTDFDVKEYHLGGPKEYVLAGRIHFLPHDVYTSFPFLTEMLLLDGMVVRGDWLRGAYAGQLVLMFFAPLTALGCYCVARRVGGEVAGWLAVLVYLTIPWTYRISIIAYTEGALCCYVVLSLLAFQIWNERRQSLPAACSSAWREVLILGFIAGSAVSTKYPGMVLVAIPFAVAVVLSGLRTQPRNVPQLGLSLVTYGVGVLVAFGPWMAKNLAETGNPVYPLLYGLFGGVDWNEALHRKWQQAHPPGGLFGSWKDFAGVIYINDWQSPLLFGFAPLAFLKRNRWTFITAGYALLLLLAWYLLTHRLDRFWVPMNSVMAVLAGCGLAAILPISTSTDVHSLKPNPKKGKKSPITAHVDAMPLSKRLGQWLASGLLGISLIYNFGYITTRYCGYNAYLASYAYAEDQTRTLSVKIIDWLQLPPDSKVLFVGEAELFNAEFPYAYNTVFDKSLLEEWTADETGPNEWTLKSRGEILQKFREEGITHVLVNWNEILRYRTTYGYTDFVTPSRMEQLIELGVLSPVALPDQIAFRDWERVDSSWKNEIERWAPTLKRSLYGKDEMLQFQCFEVPAVSEDNRPDDGRE